MCGGRLVVLGLVVLRVLQTRPFWWLAALWLAAGKCGVAVRDMYPVQSAVSGGYGGGRMGGYGDMALLRP